MNLRRGDIVLNHRQTAALIKHGKVDSHGVPSYASGTGLENIVSSLNLSSPLSNAASVVNKVDKNKKKDENEPTDMDWIEVAIDRITKAIDKAKIKAESAFKSLKPKLVGIYDEITATTKQIETQQKAYQSYMDKANSIGLSDELKEAVRLGSLNVAQYDSDTKKLIDDYKTWYDKAIEVKDGIDELHESLAELYKDAFDDVKEDYNNQLELIKHLSETYENGLDILEEKGYLGGAAYYKGLQTVQKKNIQILNKELNDLLYQYSVAMNSGEIEEYSDAWYDFNIQINGVREELQKAELELLKIDNDLREMNWDIFDYGMDRIKAVIDETDFLIDLLEESELFDKNGNITNEGLAAMGLHVQNYNQYLSEASKYGSEIKKLDKQIKEDPYDTELIERREKLLKLQQDAIKKANSEKKSVTNLTKEGYNAQISALKDLASAYNESLSNQKSMYDYQKKVEEKTKTVANLQKRLSAYSGDDSLETRATVQKLKLELEKAQDDLQQTEYDKFVSDTKKLLDDVTSDYEELINDRLDNVDELFNEAIKTTNQNSVTICDTINSASKEVGYAVSDTIKSIWSDEDGFGSIAKDVKAAMNNIVNAVNAMVSKGNEEATNTVNSTTSTNVVTKPEKPKVDPPKKDPPKEEEKKDPTQVTDDIKKNVAAAIWAGNLGWGNNPERAKRLTEVFGENNGIQALVNQYVGHGVKASSEYSYSSMRKKFKGYKTGGFVDYTGLAMVHGSYDKPELYLSSEETKDFVKMTEMFRDMSQSNLLAKGKSYGSTTLNGIKGYEDFAALLNTTRGVVNNTVGDININIPIDHVDDYNDFMNKMRTDDKFEKLIQSMTVDRLTGKSSMSKNTYRWG